MSTLSNLREVHNRFFDIARRLDLVYEVALSARDWRMLAIIISIWGEMCPDAILCRTMIQRGTCSCYTDP